MSAQWLSNSREAFGQLTESLGDFSRYLVQPSRARRLRQLLLLLLAVWAVLSLSRLIWSLFPSFAMDPVDSAQVINPVSRPAKSGPDRDVDINKMRSWHLFGEAGAEVAQAPVVQEVKDTVREGIEKGARETRLKLLLRGIVASTEDGLGRAIIEYKKQQEVYSVEDKLPVSGNVVLAKVMPQQVVLDNGGTFELLTLFDESGLDAQVPPPESRRSAAGGRPQGSWGRQLDKRTDAQATALAQSYRQRLYENPQSLVDVVNVSAVREGEELLGYRITPGKDKKQFQQLGFKSGDLVTGVNGIALNDPANTMRLYQTMRSAKEAVFELEREQKRLSLSVSLQDQGENL